MNNSGGETFLIRSSLNNNNNNNQQFAAELNQNQTATGYDQVDYHLLNRASSNNADQFMNTQGRESSSVYQDQGTEIEIEIEQQQHTPLTLMNHNSEKTSTQNGGFRGSLKRLFSDKSTSSSSINKAGKENARSSYQQQRSQDVHVSKKSNSAMNTPVMNHKNYGTNTTPSNGNGNNANHGSAFDIRTNEFASRRTSSNYPVSSSSPRASIKNSPKPKTRSGSRSGSIIQRLSFKFRSQSSTDASDANDQSYASNSSPSSVPRNNNQQDIGLPPQSSRTSRTNARSLSSQNNSPTNTNYSIHQTNNQTSYNYQPPQQQEEGALNLESKRHTRPRLIFSFLTWTLRNLTILLLLFYQAMQKVF